MCSSGCNWLEGGLEAVEKPPDIKGVNVIFRHWIVERTFGWLGRCRRFTKDFEETLESSLAWFQLAMVWVMIRRLGRGATC